MLYSLLKSFFTIYLFFVFAGIILFITLFYFVFFVL
jgi:hypothetical protein